MYIFRYTYKLQLDGWINVTINIFNFSYLYKTAHFLNANFKYSLHLNYYIFLLLFTLSSSVVV